MQFCSLRESISIYSTGRVSNSGLRYSVQLQSDAEANVEFHVPREGIHGEGERGSFGAQGQLHESCVKPGA